MKVFNINDSYFKYQKCLSGITYQFVNQLDNIYDMNLMVGTNYCTYCMYNEFDIINNFMVNLYQVDICSTVNLDLNKRYYEIDGAYLKTGHRVLLVGQDNPADNDVYNVDTRGFLILSDELAETGKTWRYKAYVKLGGNKGKQFHLKNTGNRFPLKGERKSFLDGHGYIVKSLFNYDLMSTDSIQPKLVFTDYELARISVNKNSELYNGFQIPFISSGGKIDIKYHEDSYLINVDNDTTKYITTGVTSGTTLYNYSDTTNGFGYETYIKTTSIFASNASVNDYIRLEISGSTNLYLKTFIKETGSTFIVISDYIPDNILYDFYTGSTSTYIVRNLMFSEQSNIREVMLESFYAKYFNIDTSYLIRPIEYVNNKYFDYDGLIFDIDTNNGTIYGYISGSTISGAKIISDTGEYAISDSYGNYSLNSAIGPHNITIKYDHYIDIVTGITITENQLVEMNFSMTHQTGMTYGTITDSWSSNTISGSTILATATIMGVVYNYPTITDVSGDYTLSSILSGDYTFTINATDHIQKITGATVSDQGITELNIQLDHVPILATLSTFVDSDVTLTGATTGGNVLTSGYTMVTSRGVCWNTTGSPTTADSKTIDGSGTGMFVSYMTGLAEGTTYYYRSYGINAVGTAYGDEMSFTTIAGLPILTTNTITDICKTGATTGGNVISDGGPNATPSRRGVCWSKSTIPTNIDPAYQDNIMPSGAGPGYFTLYISPLDSGTTYYVRSYDINLYDGVNEQYAYGNELSFVTVDTSIVTTSIPSIILDTSATAGGEVTSIGGSFVTARGVCWSTSLNPTISDPKTTDGSGLGTFISNVTGLSAIVTYHIRAYSTNFAGTSYGSDITFTTIDIPTVTTDAPTNILDISATCGGNVLYDGTSLVTARGVCWNNTGTPTISDPKTTNGTGTGVFVSSITSLTPGSTYYVRAYATNLAGTAYGGEQTFVAVTKPTVTTTSISDITAVSAASGGNVTSDGGATVTARGICWSTSPTPTILDNITINGTGTGSYTSKMLTPPLTPLTPYYVRAYATNSQGTSYGNELNFTTIIVIGTVYQGGIVFYVNPGGTTGLISSDSDQSIGTSWGCSGVGISTSTGINTGDSNTVNIVAGCVTVGIAAQICDSLVLSGKTDWYLPSKDELYQMYLNKTVIGAFATGVYDYYWSSSQETTSTAYVLTFNGTSFGSSKSPVDGRVRAIRKF